MQIIGTLLTTLLVIVSLLLILLILIQSGRSSGMSLFGGSSQTAFGAGAADVLTKLTGAMVAIFMILAIALTYIKSQSGGYSDIQKEFTQQTTETAPDADQKAEEAGKDAAATTDEPGNTIGTVEKAAPAAPPSVQK